MHIFKIKNRTFHKFKQSSLLFIRQSQKQSQKNRKTQKNIVNHIQVVTIFIFHIQVYLHYVSMYIKSYNQQISMKSCFFYLKASDNPPNPEDIRKALAEGTVQQKQKMMKQFIKCLVNDDTFPPMIMVIITNIIPLISKHPELRKVLLLYWEVIQKSKSPNDPTLKDEMFLACNSLRSDLLSHNQYQRGRTLRLVSRIMHKGVIEPLSSAITQNINHKSAYVRRNTVVCLYNVFMNFGSDIIGDIDQQIQQLLKTQTDLSTKRNAFILLNKSNPAKAMEYLQQQINAQALEDVGDILQLAILKVLKQKARQQPANRAKFLKIINSFTYKASQSVLLECSITSLAISNSVLSIKSALSSYVNILSKTNELNVKKIILDKLEVACKNSNYIEESLVEDLIKSLNTPSYEIKTKIMNIVSMNLNPKISESVLKEIRNEINECQDKDYLYRIIKSLQSMALKFTSLHKQLLNFITSRCFKQIFDYHRIQQLSTQCSEILGRTIRLILQKANKQKSTQYKLLIVENFKNIQSKEIAKQVLAIYGSYFTQQKQIEVSINGLKQAIGSLPITIEKQVKDQVKEEEITRPKVHFKTKILQDGSYQTQMIEEKEEINSEIEKRQQSYFRKLLAEDSIIGGVFCRNMGKMLYKIRNSTQFNKNACSILMILCSLLRNYEEHIYQVDQATIDQITSLIRRIINPQKFIKEKDSFFETKNENIQAILNNQLIQKQHQILEKNPSDIIFFRQLRKGIEEEAEFDDEQVNQILDERREKQNFVERLKTMVQLTGLFDPLYAQSFVTVNKNDIFFEILLINTKNINMLNVQIQFASNLDILVLEKAQSVNLRPYESASLRTQIRFVSGQFGLIYGYINYDNQAGIEQPYLITEQIKIDFIQFIVPAKISQAQFKLKWAEYNSRDNKYETTISKKSEQKTSQVPIPSQEIYKLIQSELHCLRVGQARNQGSIESTEEEQEYFFSKSFYGKSKLGDDFLVMATIFKDESLDITFNVRSKQLTISGMIMGKIKQIDFQKKLNMWDNEEEQEHDQKK